MSSKLPAFLFAASLAVSIAHSEHSVDTYRQDSGVIEKIIRRKDRSFVKLQNNGNWLWFTDSGMLSELLSSQARGKMVTLTWWNHIGNAPYCFEFIVGITKTTTCQGLEWVESN
jgi:hypothetical protein